MKLGMPTLIEYSELEQNILLCKRLELDFIELNMNLPICLPEYLDDPTIRRLKKEHGIEFTLHLPEELDLSSFHPPIRQGHINRCIESMEWAARAEIQTVNMHLNNGIYFTLPTYKAWINEQYEERFLELLEESCGLLYERARQLGIQLCIENTSNFQLTFISKALERLSKNEQFFLTWDTGHDAKTGYVEEPVFMKYSSRIKHMHLHDYNGKSDHQTLFTGAVPVSERLAFAEQNDLTVVIEVKTSDSLQQSVYKMKGRS